MSLSRSFAWTLAWLMAVVLPGPARTAEAVGTTAAPAVPAPSQDPTRPRIGLALSGGGARGFSHVGVLKALETLRIPVDCIAGTSAGAAVGAAYAMGLAPQEIERRLREADWDGSMFRDEPPRQEIPFRRKSRVGGDPLGVTFGLSEAGVSGSSGIFAGQQIELFLHRLLGTSREWPSFDALPVPYRAIATDLVSGALAVQGEGSLVHAVRASMAVPSAFSPVRVGERLLVDGGLTQNLPVQAVRGICNPDVVIAVNIGSPLLTADQLGGVFGVGLQMVSILMERNVVESTAALRPQDVLIVPDLGSVSAVDFARGIDGIPAGEAATLAAAPRLAHLALPESLHAALRQAQRSRLSPEPLVGGIAVAPTRFVPPAFFALDGVDRGREPGPVDTAGLQRRISAWSSSGNFTSIAYSVRPEGDGWTLWIDPQEKAWGPDYLQVGLAGRAESSGFSDFSVQAALRRTWLNARGAEWMTLARFGRSREAETRWFQPLSLNSPFFVEPRLSYATGPRRIFIGGEPVGEFGIRRSEAEFSLGVQGAVGQVRAALVRAEIEARPIIGFVDVQRSRSDISGLRVALDYDQLDDLDFSRRGQALRLRSFGAMRSMGAASDYRRDEAEWIGARTWGEHSVRARLRWTEIGGESRTRRDVVAVGGFQDLSGYQDGQFLGSGATIASLSYFRRMLALPQPFGSGLFAGVSLEAARIRSPIGGGDDLSRLGSAVYLGASTALGPAYVGLGLGESGNRALYLFLGRP